MYVVCGNLRMSKVLTLALLPALLTASFTGCSQDQKPLASKPLPEITLVPADEKGLDELVSKHKGKVVFVDFWALTCAPCKKAFPHTVELHQNHQGEGLAVVSVNMDVLEDQERALDFLKKHGATFDNLISTYDGGGTDANEAFGISPLPHLRLYDRQGRVRYKWEGKAEDLDAKVKELLAEKE